MEKPTLPDNVTRIDPGDPFSFLCHKNVPCFTDCCRQLDLALTPYDVLRLRKATGLNSTELLDRYIIIEQDEQDLFPHFYLSMVDDGKASCVFVSEEGCEVYPHRPAACRTYPMGRATVLEDGQKQEFFVLLKELHCRGFEEKTIQTIESYSRSQELKPYNKFNDRIAQIQQHEKIRSGLKIDREMATLYTSALYDLDRFRSMLINGQIKVADGVIESIRTDDEALLDFAIEWIKEQLFGN